MSLARIMNQVRVHESLCKRAGVDLDRGGAAVLYKLFTEVDNARLTELAERLGIDPPAVTRKVQQLEREGLVCRAPDPNDARASRLRLTRQGRSAIEKLLRARRLWLEALLHSWPASDKEEFARLLRLFSKTIDDDLGTPDGH